jgi:mannosyl-oligosaccharide alpha-1,2-mannosidase
MYDEAMDGIKKHLVGRTKKSNLMFTQELHPAKHPETGEQYVASPLLCFIKY